MKLTQSSEREVTSGIFPIRVPVTALAQLPEPHLLLPKMRVKVGDKKDVIDEVVGGEEDVGD